MGIIEYFYITKKEMVVLRKLQFYIVLIVKRYLIDKLVVRYFAEEYTMGKKKTMEIPCAGCGKKIKIASLRQWYCKACLKKRWQKWYKKEKVNENPELQTSTLRSCKIIER